MREWIAVFFLVIGIGVVLWLLFGLLLLPAFGKRMITLLYADGSGEQLEQAVRAYGWLRDGRCRGGTLILVDCGLNAEGLELALRLQKEKTWVSYCPRFSLSDCLELMEDRV